ncbi:hypothetical protein ABT033_36005 [Streptomyces pharetrae]|uniref:hypothetical protein n=1 Tax=Streptomyces pharetrae TaxID=291370 RepID=UPI00335A82AA
MFESRWMPPALSETLAAVTQTASSAAAVSGDFDALLRVLDPEVKLTVDTSGGVVVTLGAT